MIGELGKKVFVVGLSFSLGVTFSCRPEVCPEAIVAKKQFIGQCLGKVDYDPDRWRVNVSPVAGCSWTNLADLSIFAGFQPGMAISQARRQFGTPDEEAESGTNQFWRYHREKAVVQIGHEDQGSTFFAYRWWVLRAYPADRSAEAIFSPDVVSRLPMPEHPHEVVILNQCGLPMLEVIMKGREVQLVTWIDNPGSQL